MKDRLKDYLNTQFQKNGMKVSLRQCTETEIFYYLMLFKEGMDLPIELVKVWLDYARDVLDVSSIKQRISELENGEINLDDFSSGKEMAEYLKYGVVA